MGDKPRITISICSVVLIISTVWIYASNKILNTPITAQTNTPINAYYNKDFKAALVGLKPAAEKGDSTAQFYLGAMYYNGQGVPQDYVTAYLWMTLSKEAGNHLAVDGLKLTASQMNTSQLEKGKRLVTEWKKSHKAISK